MIGCGLPCVVPVVSAAEVVRVGADRILANRRARSFWLMEVERGCCRESHLHAWGFPRCCQGRAKVCRVLLPRAPLSRASFLPLRSGTFTGKCLVIVWGWTQAWREVRLVSGRVAAVAGAVVHRCNDREVQSSLQIVRRNPKFCALRSPVQHSARLHYRQCYEKKSLEYFKKNKKGKKKEQACFSVLPAWKDGGMLVIALNCGAVFTLDVTQCSFSCMYCIANLDLLSLFLLAGLLSGFAFVGETLTVVFWSLHLFTCASASPFVAGVSARRARARKILLSLFLRGSSLATGWSLGLSASLNAF